MHVAGGRAGTTMTLGTAPADTTLVRHEVYLTGQGAWRQLAEWPPGPGEPVCYLQSGGELLADEPSGGAPSTYALSRSRPATSSSRVQRRYAGVPSNRTSAWSTSGHSVPQPRS